jgi:hypothetical protein
MAQASILLVEAFHLKTTTSIEIREWFYWLRKVGVEYGIDAFDALSLRTSQNHVYPTQGQHSTTQPHIYIINMT